MKVLFSAGAFVRGGKERRMISLMEYLVSKKFEIGLIASRTSPNLPSVESLCIRKYDYQPGKIWFNFCEHRRAILEFDPDIIHTWTTSSTLYASIAGLGRNVRVVSSEVTNARRVRTFSFDYCLSRLSFRFAARVLSNSRAGLRSKRVPRRKARVIYNGYRFDRLNETDREKYGHFGSRQAPRVVMAARFSCEKDFETVLEAAALAQARDVRIHFILAGEGPDLARIRGRAQRLGLRNVEFPGHVSDLDNVLCHADIGVLASDPRFHEEGISNFVVECMAHGLPVVITDGFAASEIVSHGRNGYIVRERDSVELIEALQVLAADRTLAARLGRNAEKTARSRFDLNEMGARFVRVYEEVAGCPETRDVSASSPGSADPGGPAILITVKEIEGASRIGGIEHYYRSLRPHLRDDVRYFTVGKRERSRGRWEDALQGLYDWGRFWWLLRARTMKGVILNPSLSRNCLLRDGVFLLLAKARGKVAVVFFRGWDDRFEAVLDRRWVWLFRRVFGRADGAIVLAGRFKEKLLRWGYRGPVWTETTSVDDRLLAGDIGPRNLSGDVNFLFLARVERDKGIYEAVYAFRDVRRVVRNVRLTIVGDGTELPAVKALVRDEEIEGIFFGGYLLGAEKSAALRAADVYLFPSTHGEGMPNSVLEAMAFGLPVITTPVGGLGEFFEDVRMGFLIDKSDPAALARRMEMLAQDRDLRAEIGEYNAAYARKHFLASQVAGRLESIWRTAFAASAKGHSPALAGSWRASEET